MRRFLMVAAVLLAACNSPSDVDTRWATPEQVQYDPALNVDLATMTRTSSGLYWKELRAGEGVDTAKVGDNVRVHYTAWLPDGMAVQTTRGQEPIEFLLGYGFVIRGFDEGVIGMKVGSVRQLVVKPELAFGRAGRPTEGIPPLATLVFEIERLTSIAH